jgi:hypothetical protein
MEPAVEGWWKLVLAGPGLIGVVIIAAELGIEAWYLGMTLVLIGAALSFAGIILGLVYRFGDRFGDRASQREGSRTADES